MVINNKKVKATTWITRREQMYLISSEGYLKEKKCLRPPQCAYQIKQTLLKVARQYSNSMIYQELIHTLLTKSANHAPHPQGVKQD